MITKVWKNKDNGHHFAHGPEGMTVNGKPVSDPPEWVSGSADFEFGEFTNWTGGNCPVDTSKPFRCWLRDSNPSLIQPASYAQLPEGVKQSMWKHAPAPGRFDPKMDIVAYQVSVD